MEHVYLRSSIHGCTFVVRLRVISLQQEFESQTANLVTEHFSFHSIHEALETRVFRLPNPIHQTLL